MLLGGGWWQATSGQSTLPRRGRAPSLGAEQHKLERKERQLTACKGRISAIKEEQKALVQKVTDEEAKALTIEAEIEEARQAVAELGKGTWLGEQCDKDKATQLIKACFEIPAVQSALGP